MTTCNPCCSLAVIFCGFISCLIGCKTINIPEIFSGVQGFMGKTVRLSKVTFRNFECCRYMYMYMYMYLAEVTWTSLIPLPLHTVKSRLFKLSKEKECWLEKSGEEGRGGGGGKRTQCMTEGGKRLLA